MAIQTPISRGLLTKSAIQPTSRCEGKLISAMVANMAAARCSDTPFQTIIGTKWTVIELYTATRVVVARMIIQNATVLIACLNVKFASCLWTFSVFEIAFEVTGGLSSS